jgi:hypothetical protein
MRVLLMRIRIRTDPDPWTANMNHKIEKSEEISFFLSAGCSLLRAESYLNVLYGGLGMNKMQFLIKKYKFLVIKTLARNQIRIHIETNADPQQCTYESVCIKFAYRFPVVWTPGHADTLVLAICELHAFPARSAGHSLTGIHRHH